MSWSKQTGRLTAQPATAATQGPQGPQGPQGLQGDPGVDGATGPAGPSTPSADADNGLGLGTDSLLYLGEMSVADALAGTSTSPSSVSPLLLRSVTNGQVFTGGAALNLDTIGNTNGTWVSFYLPTLSNAPVGLTTGCVGRTSFSGLAGGATGIQVLELFVAPAPAGISTWQRVRFGGSWLPWTVVTSQVRRASYYLATTQASAISGSYLPLVWDTDVAGSDSEVITRSGAELTFPYAGFPKVEAVIVIDEKSGNNRAEYQARLELDTGSGFAEIPGKRVRGYSRLSAQGADNYKLQWSPPAIVAAGSKVRVSAIRAAGTNASFTGEFSGGECSVDVSWTGV